jgi:quinolinate synthase
VTECSMSDNVAAEEPEIDFIRPCNLCPYMKMISLPKILRSLETLEPRVEIPEDIAVPARLAVQKMLDAS